MNVSKIYLLDVMPPFSLDPPVYNH